MINIDSIVTALKENRMSYNVTQDGFKENIFLTYNLRSYRVEVEENEIKLLEFNLATNNKKHKNRYRLIDIFTDVEFMLAYIKNRYMLKKAI